MKLSTKIKKTEQLVDLINKPSLISLRDLEIEEIDSKHLDAYEGMLKLVAIAVNRIAGLVEKAESITDRPIDNIQEEIYDVYDKLGEEYYNNYKGIISSKYYSLIRYDLQIAKSLVVLYVRRNRLIEIGEYR